MRAWYTAECSKTGEQCWRSVLGAVVLATAIGALDAAAYGADWPGWRGPQRTGISDEAAWHAEAPRQLWRVQVGAGCSSVAVGDGRLYTMGYDDAKKQDVVYCLDADRGDEIWSYPYACSKFDSNHEGGPATTPALDGGRLYTLSVEGHLYCFDAKNGDVIWKDDLRKSLGAKPPKWGFAGSPVTLDDMLIIDVGVTAAFNKDDGELIWKSRDYGAAYATPAPFSIDGVQRVAVFNKSGVYVLDRSNGRPIMDFGWETSYGVNAATPIIDGRNVFIASGYGRGCALLRMGPESFSKVWQNKELRSQMASSILLQGNLYGFDESVLKCIDLNKGSRNWAERGLGKGTLTAADGKLIVLTEDGELVIVAASADSYQEISRTPAVDGRSWVVAVLANGRIYCRSNAGELVCFDVR
jgi:outer membrane protein assembly factor BamB